MRKIEGNLDGSNLKIGIVASRFNEFITSKLLDGAIDCLTRHKCPKENIDTVWVPGAFEMPSAVKIMAHKGGYNALICLGAIIRGGTQHNQYIANETIKGISKVSLDFDLPISFGVITPETLEQAIERAGTRMGNKGWEAALSAIEMANLFKDLKNL